MRGVVAAGHPLTASAGADALRAGGTAVDAALAALMAAFAAEPWLTSLGAGGYMLVGSPDGEDVLLDFFVSAAGRGRPRTAELIGVDVSFGDAVQLFHVGAASCGAYGAPAGIWEAHRRWGTVPLADLAAPAVRAAREGVVINAQQAYVGEILDGIAATSPEGSALLQVDGRPPREDEVLRQGELADALERLAAEGPDPFYTGDVAAAVDAFVAERGGALSLEAPAAYAPVEREPVRAAYRGREV